MSKQQPDALRLAAMLTADEWPGSVTLVSYARECVAELLRQHAENETVRAGYAAARLEIESLKAQLHAAKQINAAQFGLLAASIPGSALRVPHGQALESKIEGLTAAQESLGVEFEKVLHDNLFDLYEESPQTASHGQAPAGAAPACWIPPAREGEYHSSLTITAYREPMAGWEPLYRTPTSSAADNKKKDPL